jgi:hypothetical protein
MEWVAKLHIIDQILTYISDMSVFSVDTACLQVRMKCSYENDQQDALYKLIYYSKSALHVSGDVFAHHHECMTSQYLVVFTQVAAGWCLEWVKI